MADKNKRKKRPQEELDEELFEALGDLDTMKHLIAQGANPNAQDGDELPVLIAAIELKENAFESTKLLLESKADPKGTYAGLGWTALHAAVCGEDNLELVSLLLSYGADPNTKSSSPDAETPLTLLLSEDRRSSSCQTVKLLLEAGANPNTPRGDGWTPLMLIASGDDIEGAKLLLEAGADPKASKGEGDNKTDVVSIAAYWGQQKMMALLQSAGAKDPIDDCKERLAAYWQSIEAWCQENAKERATDLQGSKPATQEEIARLEKALNARLPTEFKAELLLHGGKRSYGSGSFYFEYSGLNIDQIIHCWEGLEKLNSEGKLEYKPKETSKENYRIRYVWWHSGWIPFAEDGGGNLLCIDVDPPAGYRGQVLYWEIHAGPVGPIADDFEAYIKGYAKKLTSGKYKYDPQSGTFDT